MAEKISTLIIKVDLDCESCYKKIKEVLYKLQDKEKITTISYDKKNNTVTISGPFDPQKLSEKLRCNAGKVIKEIQIKDKKQKEIEKGKEPEKKKDKANKPAENEKPKKTKPPAAKKDKPAEPARTRPEKPARSTPVPGPQIPAWPAGPVCFYRVSHEEYYLGPVPHVRSSIRLNRPRPNGLLSLGPK